ncbi:ABC transporter permease subunit [Paenibacillus filicis]|uniref:ABC transporter permease subunit n=1 Tax=Paenibacillus gyeongsangnamensis TaxID=3388067 RepID=A0ABT4Q5S0_9BACL|nr:ABC transporter permease subunit [Paenibacillus filicis]MCZ8512228.1 ABC transporter permease subunit [Paenibacillus filicis]
MLSFKAGLLNEMHLLVYRRKTVVFFALSTLIPILLALSLHSLQPYLGLIGVSRSFPIDMLGLYTMVWIPLFIFLTAADLFPHEISARTLKLSLLRPSTRFGVFAAKSAALAIAIAALLFVLGTVTVICSLFLGAGGSFQIMDMIKTYLASFLSMTALAALFVFVAQFFGSASGALAFSVGLYAAAKLAPFFLRSAAAFSPASYTDWHLLWISSSVSAGKLVTATLFLISSSILFFSLGYFMFNRKEV